MSSLNPYVPPESSLAPAAASDEPQLDLDGAGIGGWLILVAIGLVITPFMLFQTLMLTYKDAIVDGMWATITSAAPGTYHPLLAPLIGAEIVFNVAMFSVWTFMIYLFFAKKKVFPKWYVCAHIITCVFLIGDAIVVKIVRPDMPAIDPEMAREIGRSVFAVCVWVPYMLMSKRVRKTFRN